jgi:threonine aldolase
MREAMATALVGDDGYGEDPTVNELEARYATLVGKDAALFVPSGVMANQIALRVLARPGDLVVAGRAQHVVGFEMGAAARNAGVQFATLCDESGSLDLAEVADVIAAEDDHQPRVSLVCVENTHMVSGGVPWELARLVALRDAVGERPLYVDGARLFNAVVATGISAARYCEPASMVMTCLSKGLCAPVGSLLAGSNALMEMARVERKRLGGAMRQAGVLAAAGLVALDTMVDRLAEDHARARRLADAFARAFPESTYDSSSCVTNIVSFNHPRAHQIVEELVERGIEGGTVAPTRVRYVTHAGITDEDVDYVEGVLGTFTLSSR